MGRLLSRLWGAVRSRPGAEPPVPAAQAPAPGPRRGVRIPETAASAAQRRPLRPGETDPAQVFALRDDLHPPSVAKGRTRIAQDEAVVPTGDWAAAMFASAYGLEGAAVSFLGYPYLAELAQRPEYRVISETIATEMTREWIEFVATNEDGDDKEARIAELEEEFERLGVQAMFARAAQQDGFFGRGHIYIDTGDTDDPAELEKSLGWGWDKTSEAKVRKGAIRHLRTVEAVWCYPTAYNSDDPLKDNWYRPDQWYVQAKIVHTTRLITLIGREVPDLLKPTYSFGGLSMSQMALPYVNNWLETRQSVNDILQSFVTYVLKTDMQALVQADGQALFTRADFFNRVRDNRGLMMIDKDSEEFANVVAPLSGLSELQAQAQEHMASVSHIPTVKLLGITPSGLNASTDGEMRAWNDYIHAYQEHLFRAPLHRLMGLVMLSLWGETDADIGFVFRPLFSLDEKAKAEVEELKARTDQTLIDSGVIHPEESRTRIANDPDSDYSSIDVSDVPDLAAEELAGLDPDDEQGEGPAFDGALDDGDLVLEEDEDEEREEDES